MPIPLTPPPRPRTGAGDTAWFTQARLGLFIHWGLYALAGRHEWVMQYEKMDPAEYRRRYFGRFEADLYAPERWAELAAEAGMGYAVLTAKHHEGFCLFDSAHTDYKSTLAPCRRDLVADYLKAFRDRGLRAGLYYSLIDWSHPHFTVDRLHPLREGDRAALNQGRDMGCYAGYLHAQVRELLSRYGTVDALWLDYSYPPRPELHCEGKGRAHWRSDELLQMVRRLQPKIVLNDRLDLPEDLPGAWDIKTPEQYQPRRGVTWNGQPVVWEACQTFSGSWGYFRDEASWKSPAQLLRMLADSVAKGGNFLLNVGPTGRGEIDSRAVERLQGLGRWMRQHGRAIRGCGAAPVEFAVPEDCRLTYNPATRRVYIHLFNWPFKHLHLAGPAWCDHIAYAQLLGDASEIPFKVNAEAKGGFLTQAPEEAGTVTLTLPVAPPACCGELPVIEVFLKEP